MLFAGTEHGPDNPLLMQGAGLLKSFALPPVNTVLRHAAGAVIGAITPLPRDGNDGDCQDFSDPLFGLNAWAMPNPGKDARPAPDEGNPGYRRYLELHERIIVNVAGFNPGDYLALVTKLAGWGGVVELNFGCPNAGEKIMSFDVVGLHQTLIMLSRLQRDVTLWAKLSIYSDPGLLKEVAGIIGDVRRADGSHLLQAVVTSNTFPSGLGFHPDGKQRISTTQAGPFGGISGEALKPISLSNAAQFRGALPSEIEVIRCGGISSGRDLRDTYTVGCAGAQVVTAAAGGPQVFDRVRQEYADLMG